MDIVGAIEKSSLLIPGITKVTLAASGNYAVTSFDAFIDISYVLNASSGGTLTLPLAAQRSAGTVLYVKHGSNASQNSIAIQRSGADTIDGNLTSFTLADSARGDCVSFVSDGVSRWYIATKVAGSSI